jgi:hypothetical protein
MSMLFWIWMVVLAFVVSLVGAVLLSRDHSEPEANLSEIRKQVEILLDVSATMAERGDALARLDELTR